MLAGNLPGRLPPGLCGSTRFIACPCRFTEIGQPIAHAYIFALTDLNWIAAPNGFLFRFNVMSFCSGEVDAPKLATTLCCYVSPILC